MSVNKQNESILSVVVPVYNEAGSLEAFHQALTVVLEALPEQWRILYVDDGSKDDSPAMLRAFAAGDDRISVLELSRNFGKEAAMTAGLDVVDADAVVVMDADLQHPPEVIAQFAAIWRSGVDVVFARRRDRANESVLKRFGTRLFYKLLRDNANIDIPEDASDFRLMSRRAVDALRQLRESHRFMKGLFSWIGFDQQVVEYECAAREAGSSKWSTGKLINFAVEGITSFSIRPLRIASIIGASTAILSMIYGVWIIFRTLVYGDPVRGYPSLFVMVLFLGGMQLLALGLIGEYLGRNFNESKRRPVYLIKQISNPENLTTTLRRCVKP